MHIARGPILLKSGEDWVSGEWAGGWMVGEGDRWSLMLVKQTGAVSGLEQLPTPLGGGAL